MREIFILIYFAETGKVVSVKEYGEDLSAASIEYDKTISSGGPNGVVRQLLVGSKKYHKSVDVYPVSWHQEQRDASIAASQKSASDKLLAQLPELLDSWDKTTDALADLHTQIAELDPALAAKLQPDTNAPPLPNPALDRLEILSKSLVDAGLDPEKDLAAQLAKLAAQRETQEESQDPPDASSVAGDLSSANAPKNGKTPNKGKGSDAPALNLSTQGDAK